ncbi:hypothetical protein GCM10027051_30300 [Niabella terrae]
MKFQQKAISIFALILLFTLSSFAQVRETIKVKNASVQSTVLLARKQKDLDDNFKLNAPTERQDLKKRFRISGYGVPGASIEIHITPVSKGGSGKPVFVAAGKQSPYGVQNYRTTVGSKGSWSLPETVTVKFRDGATGRYVKIVAGQAKDGLKSRKPVRCVIKLADDKLIAVSTATLLTDDKVRNDFKVYTNVGNGITASSIDMLSAAVGTAPFKIRGTGTPKSKVFVDVYYSGTKIEYTKLVKVMGVPAQIEKKVTPIKNKKLGRFEKSIGDDGKWQILAIDPYEPKSGDVGTELIMSSIVIHFRAMNGNKEVLKKSVTLSVVASSDLGFFKQ